MSRAACFEKAFFEMCGDWLAAHPRIPVLASGMVGSNQGWREAEYLDLPASVDAIAAHLITVPFDGGELSIVPGLYNPGDTRAGTPPDVIRGEEVQILGVLSGHTEDTFLLMPGTHTKWVRCASGVVTDFSTAMTGELYALVMGQSIVGRLALPAGQGSDAATRAFDEGLRVGQTDVGERGLAALLFTGRTLVMGGRLDPTAVGDYVSGLLVGDEVAHMLRAVASDRPEILVCGTSDLARRYSRALALHGVRVAAAREDAAIDGLWSIATAAGLVGGLPRTLNDDPTGERA